MRLAQFLREPARDDGLGHRAAAVLAHRRRTLQPCFGRRQLRAGTQQDEPVDALRVAGGQPHRRHPAERQTDDVRAFDPQTVEQRDDVVGQVVDRVRPGGHRGRPVAAGVIADHHEPLLQLGDLRVPHDVGGSQRVGQHNGGPIGAPAYDAVYIDRVQGSCFANHASTVGTSDDILKYLYPCY